MTKKNFCEWVYCCKKYLFAARGWFLALLCCYRARECWPNKACVAEDQWCCAVKHCGQDNDSEDAQILGAKAHTHAQHKSKWGIIILWALLKQTGHICQWFWFCRWTVFTRTPGEFVLCGPYNRTPFHIDGRAGVWRYFKIWHVSEGCWGEERIT